MKELSDLNETSQTRGEMMSNEISTTAPKLKLVKAIEVTVANDVRAGVSQLENEANIVEQTADFIRRFVFFRRDEIYLLVAAWVVATYLIAEFDFAGYLFAHSAEPQSGKSRLLEVLNLLVHKPSGILVSPTEAVLVRTADDHTQLLDEIDAWKNKNHVRSVLNAGFERHGAVLRTKDSAVVRYPVFGPRALAGIGTRVLDRTTLDRTFAIEMVRQTYGERREPFRARRIASEAARLKGEIEAWAAANQKKIAVRYHEPRRFYLEGFTDRTIDITEPLAAVVEVAFAGDSKLERARFDLISAVGATRDEQDAPQDHHSILRALVELCGSDGRLLASASEIAERCRNLDPMPSAEEISALLRSYGFKSKSVRLGDSVRYRYVIHRSKLDEILLRYARKESAVEQSEQAPERDRVESIL